MEKYCDQVVRNPSSGRRSDDDYRCIACLGNFIGRNKDIFNKRLYYLWSVCGNNRECVSSWISYSVSLTKTPLFAPAIVIHIS